MSSSNRAATRNLVIAGILLFGFVVIGVAFRFLVYPLLQGELITATSTPGSYDHTITLRLDSFSGYAPLRSDTFEAEMRSKSIKVDFVDDAADYASRIKALRSGDADMAVFTVDAFIAAGAAIGEYPGSIVMVLDETYGADAIVAYKSAVPDLQTLNQGDGRMVLTPGSPSEFLARVAIAEFGLDRLSKRWIGEDGAEAVHKRMKKAKRDQRRGYVVWEPYRSQAVEDPAVHVLFDSSRLAGYIVDVLVVNRQFLVDHPDLVRAVVEASLRSLHAAQKKGADGMVELVRADARKTGSKLTDAQARNIVDGIRWRNTLENYTHLGLVESRPGLLALEDSVQNITQVLVRTGALNEDPLQGRPGDIYFDGVLRQMQSDGFHPAGLGITGQPLDAARGVTELPSLTERQWEQLTPVGSMQVKPISFGRGTARLHVQSQRELDQLARRLQSLPNYYLTVRGHTRAEGDPEANRKLAQQRASAAREYLTTRAVSETRIRAVAAAADGAGGQFQSVSFELAQQPY